MKQGDYLLGFADGVTATRLMLEGRAKAEGKDLSIDWEPPSNVIKQSDVEKAAEILKLVCLGYDDCEGCPFDKSPTEEGGNVFYCRLNGVPDGWDLSDPADSVEVSTLDE